MQVALIEAFPIESVKGESFAVRDMSPDLAAGVRTLMSKVPVVVHLDTEEQPQLPFPVKYNPPIFTEAEAGLYQATSLHNRSFEIDARALPSSVTDAYGNTYGHFSLKGGNFSWPGLFESATASSGQIPHGLQETDYIERILKASQIMRANGLPTEYVIAASEPSMIYFADPRKRTGEGVLMGRREYGARIASEAWASLPKELQTMEELTKLNRAVNGKAFIVTLRATVSPYRIQDVFSEMSTLHQKLGMVIGGEVHKFSLYSGEDDEEILRHRDQILLSRLGVEGQNDLDEHLTDAVANTARQLATMHKVGIAHRYPWIGNVDIHGNLLDLDSVYGEPLGFGDIKIGPTEMAKDILYFIESFVDGKQRLSASEGWRKRTDRDEFISVFVKHYKDTMAGGGEYGYSADDVFDALLLEFNENSHSSIGAYFENTIDAYDQKRIFELTGKNTAELAVSIEHESVALVEAALERIKASSKALLCDALVDICMLAPDNAYECDITDAKHFKQIYSKLLKKGYGECSIGEIENYCSEAVTAFFNDQLGQVDGLAVEAKSAIAMQITNSPEVQNKVQEILGELLFEHQTTVIDELTRVYDEVMGAKDTLLGSPQPANILNARNEMIFVARNATSDTLGEVFADMSRVSVRSPFQDTSEADQFNYTFTHLTDEGEEVVQVVWFDYGLSYVEGYNTDQEGDSSGLQLAQPENDLLLVVQEDITGNRNFVFYTNDRVVLERYEHDPSVLINKVPHHQYDQLRIDF